LFKITKEFKYAVVFILVIFLIASVIYKTVFENLKTKKYIATRQSLSADTVLDNYFKFLKNSDKHLLKLTLAPKYKNIKINSDIDYEVIHIEKIPNDEITFSYLKGIEVTEVSTYSVQLMKRDHSSTYTMRYILCKENKKSPWLIYNWGISF